jgi:hypothetical protein
MVTSRDADAGDQYWSFEMTSPPAMVPRARQTVGSIEFLQNFTLPSAKRALTPPEWYTRRGLVWHDL